MGLLQQILEIDDLAFKDVPVPQWKGLVIRIRALTAKQRDEFEKTYLMKTRRGSSMVIEPDEKSFVNARARLVAICAYDPKTGEKVFTTPESVEQLGDKNAAAVDLLYTEARELSGLTKKDMDELEKN